MVNCCLISNLFDKDFLSCYYSVMKLEKHHINWIVFAAVVVACILLDQITKFCFEGMETSLIGNFLWITSTRNEGAAFSMLEGARWWFVAFSFVAMAVLLFVIFARKISEKPLFVVSIALVFGGIVGNLIDRIAFGYVRDFIDFRFSGFAIFNFADSVLCVGCALLVLFLILWNIEDIKKKKEAVKADTQTQSEALGTEMPAEEGERDKEVEGSVAEDNGEIATRADKDGGQ